MTINARMLITVLLLAGLAPLWAQNQRIAWVGDEYAMRYEVIIEKEKEGAYSRLLREFTEESFIEVSLSSGKYRCQVIPYDFLNQPIPVKDWVEFEVRSSFHEIITVTEIPSAAPEAEEVEAVSTEAEKIIEYKNKFDLYLSVAWIPLLPIYQEGKTKENIDESKFFGKSAAISAAGAAVRFGIVSAKRPFFNPGMELTASWHLYTTSSGEKAQSLLFDCDTIQQFHLSDNRTALNLRLGMGVSLVSSDDLGWVIGEQYSTHINTGASLICLLPKNFFMETGMEYSQLFTKDFFCFIRLWLGLGYKF